MAISRGILRDIIIGTLTLPPRLEPKDESYSMYKSMLEVMLAWARAPRHQDRRSQAVVTVRLKTGGVCGEGSW